MFFKIFALLLVSWCSVKAHYPLTKVNSTADILASILCRECGTEILRSHNIIAKASTAALYSFNDTLFNKQEVLIQLLAQDIFMRYPVITSSESSCHAKGDWENDDLWFPDHFMKPCFCPECGAFVGWKFKNEVTNSLLKYPIF